MESTIIQGGSTANKNGDIMERQIETLLISKGYCPDKLQDKGFVRQYMKFTNLYGVPWRLDFFLVHHVLYPNGLAIESKWQSSVGSADEKLVFALKSLEELPCPGVLVIGSDGARSCAVNWCKLAAESNPKLTVLHGLDHVLKWAQKYL